MWDSEPYWGPGYGWDQHAGERAIAGETGKPGAEGTRAPAGRLLAQAAGDGVKEPVGRPGTPSGGDLR